jgi:hypothetical protein
VSTHLPKPPLPQVQVKLLGRRYATGPDRVKVTHRFLYRPNRKFDSSFEEKGRYRIQVVGQNLAAKPGAF